MKLRVLHVLGWIASGGVEQMRLMLARGLPRDQYEHMVITQRASGSLPEALKAEGWMIRETGLAPHILSPSWHRQAYEFARDFSPDIVHGAVFEGVALAAGIGLRMPRVRVISEETSDPVNRSWRGDLLMRGFCLRSDIVIGVSAHVGDYLRKRAGIPFRKIRVIDNAVMPVRKACLSELQQLRDSLGFIEGDAVIGSIGRLFDSHKRFSDLIKAVRLLRDRKVVAKLLIVGDGPDRGELENLTVQLGLEDAVVFAGYQGDARKYYPLLDVFALASAREAFGLVLVEAMLAGIPVVATGVGGIPHVLKNGAAGRLVSPKSPEDLAEAIGDLLNDSVGRTALGQAGRLHAEQAFSAERYCGELDALYHELVR